jgi:hypothetical protein
LSVSIQKEATNVVLVLLASLMFGAMAAFAKVLFSKFDQNKKEKRGWEFPNHEGDLLSCSRCTFMPDKLPRERKEREKERENENVYICE